METIGSIEEARMWALSCVLRIPTAEGPVYFKATADMDLFVNEPSLTRRLGPLFPGRVPDVLAVDEARGWMLTSDFGNPVGGDGPVADIVGTFRQWSAMQRSAADHLGELLAAGCRDRRLDTLPDQFADLLRNTVALAALPDGASRRLAAATDVVPRVCDALRGYAVPDSLVHGDLHMGNVAAHSGSFVIFDWTDACVSHPFMDGLLPYRMSDARAREQIREATLEAWTDVEPLPRLREAWELAQRACIAHHVVSYGVLVADVPVALREDLGDFFCTLVDEFLDIADGMS